jgi:class 3 adenylate cyclase
MVVDESRQRMAFCRRRRLPLSQTNWSTSARLPHHRRAISVENRKQKTSRLNIASTLPNNSSGFVWDGCSRMSTRRPFHIQIDEHIDNNNNNKHEYEHEPLISSNNDIDQLDSDEALIDNNDMPGFIDDYFSRARGSIVATASFIALSFSVTAILFSVAAFTTLAEAFQLTWVFVVATLMNVILAIAGCWRGRVSVSAFVWVYLLTVAGEAIAVSVEGVLELDDVSMMPRDSGSGNRGETTVVLAAAVLIGMRPVRFWLPASFFAAVLATNVLWNWFTVQRIYPEAVFVAFATVLFVAIAALRERTARQQYALRRRVASRLQQSQALLANILPFSFARRLARCGDAQAAIVTLADTREAVSTRAIVDEFDCVTLMFLELCNFRDLVHEARGDGRALVGELHRLYAALDDLCVRFGVEKIESVGNVFVAASGLRRGSDERRECLRVVALAHAAHECVAALNAASPHDAFKFQIRIGVNSGRARAGVVGNHRTMFKIFGDTMNTASRMESNSAPQRTTASPAVFALVEAHAELLWEDRGVVEVKGKGAMRLRFVSIRNLAAVERQLLHDETEPRVATADDTVLGDEQLPATRPWFFGNVFVNEELERAFVLSLVTQNRPFRWLILGVALTLVLGWGATFSSSVPPKRDAETIVATIGAPFVIGALAFVAVSVLDARRAATARFVLGATFAALLASQLFATWLGIASQPPVRFAISSITTSAVFHCTSGL